MSELASFLYADYAVYDAPLLAKFHLTTPHSLCLLMAAFLYMFGFNTSRPSFPPRDYAASKFAQVRYSLSGDKEPFKTKQKLLRYSWALKSTTLATYIRAWCCSDFLATQG